jgi:hypothetical protein
MRRKEEVGTKCPKMRERAWGQPEESREIQAKKREEIPDNK